MDDRHRVILQRNHRLLVNSLNLSNTTVLDHLVEEGMVSSGEQDDIMSRSTSRDQNTRLLFVLKRRGPGSQAYDTFVKALQKDYEFVVDKLRAWESKLEGQEDNKAVCINCLLMRNLIPSDVSHVLFEEDMITDDDLEELNNNAIPRQERVKKLLTVLQGNPNEAVAVEKLRGSLLPKYNYIVASTENARLSSILSCQCPGRCAQKDLDTGQTQNVDTSPSIPGTEDMTSLGVLYTRGGLMESRVCYDQEGEARLRQEQCENTFLGTSLSLQQRSLICERMCTVSLEEVSGEKKPKRFTRRRRKVGYEPDSAVAAPSCDQTGDLIFQHAGRSFPNDNKLMRKCTKLWDHLFCLREKGDWVTFNLVSEKAFQTFSNNPDIQVLMYRSEMCISTFYKNDPTKAMNMYEKAMEILPKTSMPDWHLARILPLRMELCTRLKQFEEANSLLEQAHQAMAFLSPCLSTGAVYFFEAKYLGAFLRCSGSSSRSESIAQRVKSCFLTAINHYQQEKFFAIKSFLNQVYLFFALFTLGVDINSIGYIGTIRSLHRDELERAEHYLKLFENDCWSSSTTWSRMLFYIGRGEQYKLQGHFQRSLDYYHDAKQCAVEGEFQEHLAFIEQNLHLVGDKLEEQQRLQAMNVRSADDIIQSLFESSDDSGSGEN